MTDEPCLAVDSCPTADSYLTVEPYPAADSYPTVEPYPAVESYPTVDSYPTVEPYPADYLSLSSDRKKAAAQKVSYLYSSTLSQDITIFYISIFYISIFYISFFYVSIFCLPVFYFSLIIISSFRIFRTIVRFSQSYRFFPARGSSSIPAIYTRILKKAGPWSRNVSFGSRVSRISV